jgi:hypothetical protein
VPPNALQVFGSRGEINAIEGGAITSTNQRQTGRSRHYIGTTDLSELVVGFNGFYIDAVTSGNFQTCAEVNDFDNYVLRLALKIYGISKTMTFDVARQSAMLANVFSCNACGLLKRHGSGKSEYPVSSANDRL